MRTLPFFSLLFAASSTLLAQTEAVPASPERMAEFRERIRATVHTCERVALDAAELDELAAKLGAPTEALAAIELYRATLQRPNQEEPYSALVVFAPVRAISDTGRMIYSLRDGGLEDLSLWGTEEIDIDPQWHWSVYLAQLSVAVRDQRKAAWRTVAAEKSSGAASTSEASSKSQPTEWTTAMQQQKLAMNDNRQLANAMRNLKRGARNPDPKWFTRLAKNMDELAERAESLRPVMSEHALEPYRKAAGDAAEAMRRISALAPDAEFKTFATEFKVLQKSCTACHNTVVSPDSDVTLFDAFDPVFEARAPWPLRLEVGKDVNPALGDTTGTISKATARALELSLALADRLP